MKTFGLILIVLGLLGLAFDQISFTREKEALDLGSVEINTEETETFPLYPVAAGGAILVGVVLILVDRKKKG